MSAAAEAAPRLLKWKRAGAQRQSDLADLRREGQTVSPPAAHQLYTDSDNYIHSHPTLFPSQAGRDARWWDMVASRCPAAPAGLPKLSIALILQVCPRQNFLFQCKTLFSSSELYLPQTRRSSLDAGHSTVTLFAKFLGWSTSVPFATAT
jgi:hypothetical protein